MKQFTALAALVLAVACGPSAEAVECCECLRGTTHPMEIIEDDAGVWTVDPAGISADECPVALDEGRVVADLRSWRPGESYPDERPTCHAECAARTGELALAEERL